MDSPVSGSAEIEECGPTGLPPEHLHTTSRSAMNYSRGPMFSSSLCSTSKDVLSYFAEMLCVSVEVDTLSVISGMGLVSNARLL